MCGDEDDWQEGPCFAKPCYLGAILIVIFLFLFTAFALSVYDTHEVRKSSTAIVESFALQTSVRPQFYTVTKFTNDSRIPSTIIMVKDESLYSRAHCTYSNPHLVSLSYLLQFDVDFGSGVPSPQIEFRFEVPYGTQIPSSSSNTRVRCPEPDCGYINYQTGLGSGALVPAESTFYTNSEIYFDRTEKITTPLLCGCSREIPPRFSCTMGTTGLDGKTGALMVMSNMQYYSGLQ